MTKINWKNTCLTLVLAAAGSTGSLSWGQGIETGATSQPVSIQFTAAEEEIFDSVLAADEEPAQPVSTAGPFPCVNPPAGVPSTMPFADPSAVPSTDPSATPFSPPNPAAAPQAMNPDSVFSNAGVGALGAGQGALTAQANVAALMPGGYLDPVAPATMFRLRYDVASNNAYPDRGEYFYAKCGCYRQAGIDPNAAGPGGINTSVDFQEIRGYFEYAFNRRFSMFGELPVRFVDYDSQPGLPAFSTTSGFADMNVGFKYALIAEPDEYLTFQVRAYLPTGQSEEGLGTDHVSIEPSLLYYRRLSQKWLFQGQFSEFSPIGGSDFASDVLQYGAGLSYILHQGRKTTIMPTIEVVGWTFLNGQKFSPIYGQSSASGDTIVNVKPGVRIGLGDAPGPAMMQKHSVYAGFGVPVTNEQFYGDIFRLEYRILF
jgi:hypothetical protein